MENFVALVFVAVAGCAVFAGVYKEDLSEGRVPAPIAAYWKG